MSVQTHWTHLLENAMNFIPRWGWLRTVTGRRAAPRGFDAADMGTAFGLDATLCDPPAHPQPPQLGGTSALLALSRHTGLPRHD